MVVGETSDLYASDTYTWSATSIAQGTNEEPKVNSHSPSLHLPHLLGVYLESVISVHR
jgi:hypothetical protein